MVSSQLLITVCLIERKFSKTNGSWVDPAVVVCEGWALSGFEKTFLHVVHRSPKREKTVRMKINHGCTYWWITSFSSTSFGTGCGLRASLTMRSPRTALEKHLISKNKASKQTKQIKTSEIKTMSLLVVKAFYYGIISCVADYRALGCSNDVLDVRILIVINLLNSTQVRLKKEVCSHDSCKASPHEKDKLRKYFVAHEKKQ